MFLEDKPFESLTRGLNKDLRVLLDTEESDSSKSARAVNAMSTLGITHVPFRLADRPEESFQQRPFASLSDRFAHEIVVFPLVDHVVINRFGAYIPRSIFGQEFDISYTDERNQSGTVRVSIQPKQSELQGITRNRLEKPLLRDDPIFEIGRDPVVCGISDASEDLDKYLYGGE